MILSYDGKVPVIHPTAWVAPDATVCGDVGIGANTRVLYGARIIAEGGRIEIGETCIVMENAVVRSTGRHSASIGNNCLIGPNAHVAGCTIEDQGFIATGAAIFHGSHLEKGCEVRINGVVHLKTKLPEGSMVPIGWVAVGDPAEILPPDRHDEIWEIQKPLHFPVEVYGLDRSTPDLMQEVTRRLSDALAGHQENIELND